MKEGGRSTHAKYLRDRSNIQDDILGSVDHPPRRVSRERIADILLEEADGVRVGARHLVNVDLGVQEGRVCGAVESLEQLKRVGLEGGGRDQFWVVVRGRT